MERRDEVDVSDVVADFLSKFKIPEESVKGFLEKITEGERNAEDLVSTTLDIGRLKALKRGELVF